MTSEGTKNFRKSSWEDIDNFKVSLAVQAQEKRKKASRPETLLIEFFSIPFYRESKPVWFVFSIGLQLFLFQHCLPYRAELLYIKTRSRAWDFQLILDCLESRDFDVFHPCSFLTKEKVTKRTLHNTNSQKHHKNEELHMPGLASPQSLCEKARKKRTRGETQR